MSCRRAGDRGHEQAARRRAKGRPLLWEDLFYRLNVVSIDLPPLMQVMLAPAEVGCRDPLNLSEIERRTVRAALEQAKGNKAHAAKMLGISRRALYRLITKYGLEDSQADAIAGSE